MEDTKQEILIELYRKLKNFRFESSFKTYLYRLARNRAIDMIRKKSRERKKISAFRETIPDKYIDPEEEIIKSEERRSILDAVFLLEESERVLLLMKDAEGFSIRSISESMGIPEGTVKSRLHRARARVVTMLRYKGGAV